MEKQLHFFLIYFSVISVISIAAVHFYIKDKLREKHDNGLLWVSAAVFCWVLMGILEYVYSCNSCKTVNETIQHIQNLPKSYWHFRKIFSIFNSALFIYSLSYFKEGWLGLYKKFEKTNLGMLAAVTIIICLNTFFIDTIFDEGKQIWIITDSVVSSIVAFLLCFCFSAIFYQRGMKFMLILSISLTILLIATQIIEMIKEVAFFKNDIATISFWTERYIDDTVRMLSRPLLIINILGVAISWLGNQSEIMVVERDPMPAKKGNSLRFEERGNRYFVSMSLDSNLSPHNTERKERILLVNKVFELNFSPFDFYHKCAKDVRNVGDFRHNDHADNFDTKIKLLLVKINIQLELDGVAGRPLTKLDLFKPVPMKKGIWTLVHEKDEIDLG